MKISKDKELCNWLTNYAADTKMTEYIKYSVILILNCIIFTIQLLLPLGRRQHLYLLYTDRCWGQILLLLHHRLSRNLY